MYSENLVGIHSHCIVSCSLYRASMLSVFSSFGNYAFILWQLCLCAHAFYTCTLAVGFAFEPPWWLPYIIVYGFLTCPP